MHPSAEKPLREADFATLCVLSCTYMRTFHQELLLIGVACKQPADKTAGFRQQVGGVPLFPFSVDPSGEITVLIRINSLVVAMAKPPPPPLARPPLVNQVPFLAWWLVLPSPFAFSTALRMYLNVTLISSSTSPQREGTPKRCQ